jgi:SAM-dependent methyltransferase
MNLTFGQAQVFTSSRMNQSPILSKVFNQIFGYTNVGNYARFTIFKKLIQEIPFSEKPEILDLGTGYGEYAFSLAKAIPSAIVHALDIDGDRVAAVNQAISKSRISNIRTHHAFLENTSICDLDFVFSVDVFEHILPAQMPFKTVHEKLKPGGHFLVKIPNVTQKTIFPERYFEEHQDWLEEEHVGQVYDLQGLKARFESEGFEIVHASYSDGIISRLAWELAYLGKKAGVITQLLSLPIAKRLIHLDRIFHSKKEGNAIQVIGRKVYP